MRELKLAFRSLIRTPFVTGIAILSLALGIGANAAIYSLVDGMLLRSLPVQEPDRLVNLTMPGPNPGSQSCGQAGGCDAVLSYPMLRGLESLDAASLAGFAGHVSFGANLAFDGTTTSGEGLQVTGGYFPTLGIQPALGRLFGPADDAEIGAHYLAVLNFDYWQNDLGGDPQVLNRTIIINGESMTVVGVTPQGFRGTVLGNDPDVFVPMTMRAVMHPWFDDFENRRSYWAYAFARLAPGATMEQAAEEMNGYYSGVIQEVDAPLQTGMTEARMADFRAKQIVLSEGWRGQSNTHAEIETPFRLLMGITGLVLLIACANIANLLLARGAARGTEMAVRGSLGASRGQLLRQLMLESMMLALAAGTAGVVVGVFTLKLLGRFLPSEAFAVMGVGMNPAVLGFTAVISIGTGLLFGLYPAVHATRTDLATLIRAGSGKGSDARAATRFRNVLVTAQIALSMALLVGAGLFVRSLSNISQVDLGLEPESVLQFAIAPGLNGYGSEETLNLFVQAEERLAAIPGVRAVTASIVGVLAGNSWGNDASVEGFLWEPGVDANSRYTEVGPGFYSTMGIPLLAGREFTEMDVLGEAPVAIINEAFARKFGLDPRDAVGKRMARGSNADELDMEIVGIVADAKYSDVKDDVPSVFALPYRQDDALQNMNFYVRLAGDAQTVIPAIRREVAAMDANLPIEGMRMLEDQIKENITIDRLIGTLASAFAMLATLLAAVGLYGVLTYAIAQRTREIGIRMALGAGGQKVTRMVMRQVAGMTVVGAILGVGAAIFLGGLAESLLFGMDDTDPLVIGLTVVVMSAVSGVAGYLPARRASKVDPMVALRYE